MLAVESDTREGGKAEVVVEEEEVGVGEECARSIARKYFKIFK